MGMETGIAGQAEKNQIRARQGRGRTWQRRLSLFTLKITGGTVHYRPGCRRPESVAPILTRKGELNYRQNWNPSEI